MEKIDFVLAWVDDTDLEWQAEREKYCGVIGDGEKCRYRDWDLLHYWFRGVEKFAPWVNKIHFVTWGHLPEWLNTEHEKLNIVKHEDYIPHEYLPTFNSHTIELNFHRINGLEEQFVYFNDDMFILDKIKPEDFFIDGKPCDTLGFEPLRFDSHSIAFIDANNVAVINDIFKKREFVKKEWRKIFDPTIGYRKMIKNLLLFPFPYFTGFYNHHSASSFLKSSYQYAWEIYGETLEKTCRCKIRETTNVNQWLIKDLQFVSGNFMNRKPQFSRRFNIRKGNYKKCAKCIKGRSNHVLCVNDNETLINFEKIRECIASALDSILGVKSNFEK